MKKRIVRRIKLKTVNVISGTAPPPQKKEDVEGFKAPKSENDVVRAANDLADAHLMSLGHNVIDAARRRRARDNMAETIVRSREPAASDIHASGSIMSRTGRAIRGDQPAETVRVAVRDYEDRLPLPDPSVIDAATFGDAVPSPASVRTVSAQEYANMQGYSVPGLREYRSITDVSDFINALRELIDPTYMTVFSIDPVNQLTLRVAITNRFSTHLGEGVVFWVRHWRLNILLETLHEARGLDVYGYARRVQRRVRSLERVVNPAHVGIEVDLASNVLDIPRR